MSLSERLRQQPDLFHKLTGLSPGEFDRLRTHFSRGSTGDKPDSGDNNLLMALMWLRTQSTYGALAALFDINKANTKRIVRDYEKRLLNQTIVRLTRVPLKSSSVRLGIEQLLALYPDLGALLSQESDVSAVTLDTAIRPVAFSQIAQESGLFLILFLSNELILTFINVEIGFMLHIAILAGCIAHALRNWNTPTYRLFLSLSFAPIVRILSLTLPLTAIPQMYWYLLTGIPLIATALVAIRPLGYSRADVGLTLKHWPLQLLIGCSGCVMGGLEYVLLGGQAPLVAADRPVEILLAIPFLLIGSGFAEEILFRGVMQRAATDTLGRYGPLFVAMIFAVLHIGNRSVLGFLLVFVFGLYFAWIVNKTGSILGVSIAHGLTNIMLLLILPLWG